MQELVVVLYIIMKIQSKNYVRSVQTNVLLVNQLIRAKHVKEIIEFQIQLLIPT